MFRLRRRAATMCAATFAALLAVTAAAGPAAARDPLPDRTDDAFQHDCRTAHNAYRARHGAPPLTTDPAAVAYARSRAAVASRSEGLSGGHGGPDRRYGENLYWAGSSRSGHTPATCARAVRSWYDQIAAYDFAAGGFSAATGSFTQVVWRSTTGIGCARAAGRGPKWYETYVVCDYRPPGNVAGRFRQNVRPPETD